MGKMLPITYVFGLFILTFRFSAIFCTQNTIGGKERDDYTDMRNYQKSVHLFYQDWMSDEYGKANFTKKEENYYKSLLYRDEVAQSGHISERYSVMGGNKPPQESVDDLLVLRVRRDSQSDRELLEDLMEQLGEMDGLTLAEKKKKRQKIRRKIKEAGLWRLYLLTRRETRSKRLEGPSGTIAPPPTPAGGRAPPINPSFAAGPKIDEKIPIPDPREEEKIIERKLGIPKKTGSPSAPPRKDTQAGPPPPSVKKNVPNPDAGSPVASEDSESELLKRSKRSDYDSRKFGGSENELSSLTTERMDLFESALKWLMTERVEGKAGSSHYDLFVRKHRISEYPQAYSKEDNFKIHSEFLKRFENALQQYNSTVKLPHYDVCKLILQPNPENIRSLSRTMTTINNKITQECSWIGATLKRSPAISGIALKKLDDIFRCTAFNGTAWSFGMDDYAALHSLFGPCVAGGSHIACPTCAVSDPFFWLLYANINRVMLNNAA